MTNPLRVALQMLSLVPGGMGGTETYAAELVRHLDASSDTEAVALVPQGAAGVLGARTEHVLSGVSGGASTVARLRSLAEAGVHRRAIRAEQRAADVVHVPFTVAVPMPPAGVPLVQSLHDVQHLDMPQFFGRPERYYRKHFYDATARRAEAVVTLSEFSKQRIVQHLGVSADRVFVVPLGVDVPPAATGEREAFLLYPARAWPHKNHGRLLEAMQLLRAEDPALRLVLTGGGLEGLGVLPDWVQVRGLVPRSELLQLYRTARAVVFPSLYEGFGLPPLEAMAAGCPVATSTAGALPEVCGDAAVYFDPQDPSAIARGVMVAEERRDELSRLGLARARLLSWKACAAEHERIYHLVAGR